MFRRPPAFLRQKLLSVKVGKENTNTRPRTSKQTNKQTHTATKQEQKHDLKMLKTSVIMCI